MLKVYFDLDGCLANFDLQVKNLTGLDSRNLEKKNKSTFWKTIDAEGVDFWSNIPLFEWSIDVWNYLLQSNKFDPYILTSPSAKAESSYGKVLWLQRNLRLRGNERFIITAHKELLASPVSLLIDDSKKKLVKFHVAGGNVLEFPSDPSGLSGKIIINKINSIYEACLVGEVKWFNFQERYK